MRLTFILAVFFFAIAARAEDGYDLWLRYQRVGDQQKLNSYRTLVKGWMVDNASPTAEIARNEFRRALPALLGQPVDELKKNGVNGLVIAGTWKSPSLAETDLRERLKNSGEEGFVIFASKLAGKQVIVIAGQNERGMLYGVFHFLRLIQTHQSLAGLSVRSSPRTKVRILNHWDNLDRTVERGYAGFSIWDWHKLPDYIDPRYYDYARANASIGINGTVLTNVNANALILTPMYLEKVAALANVFRPYGIKVYLTARFSAPIEIGGLKTADPLDPDVQKWWRDKIAEIFRYVPDFGGFTVKANSEGQPGPQNYGRSHADGANMLADALKPFNGVVMWRAFVYDNDVPVDRTKQAYDEFKPLDGKFRPNVMVQVKSGPLDFQPREPFHPLFGAMPATPLTMEFQITQEYLGFATHLVYLAPLFEEVLDSDTWSKGSGSTVGKVVDGSLEGHTLSGMAGVANIGSDRNWCGHPIAQANWYAFGRFAWDHALSSETIADEWIRMTFNNNPDVVKTLKEIMMASREITVKYMTPLGLHHIMGRNHHYGPGPWVKGGRADWTSVYYHRADENGIGFDRSSKGSNALEQYQPEVRKMFDDVSACPEEYLLWFHHPAWDYRMKSGRTLWDEMCHQYYAGADSVIWMQKEWDSLKGKIDDERYQHVRSLLHIQQEEAVRWRNSCVLYFQTFSGRPIPEGLQKPEHSLEYYQGLEFPFAPGIRPRW
jgi:alpha-glucuronidase